MRMDEELATMFAGHHSIVVAKADIAEFENTKAECLGLIKYDAKRISACRKELQRLRSCRSGLTRMCGSRAFQRINAAIA